MDKYKVIKTIGDGTYGSVAKAYDKDTGEVVAIKNMKKKVLRLLHAFTIYEFTRFIKARMISKTEQVTSNS
jgi:serine/threonine protein kinase